MADKAAKLCGLGLARMEGSAECVLTPEREATLSMRWLAPEVLREQLLTKPGDVW